MTLRRSLPIALALALVAATTSATVVLRLSLAELVDRAEVILEGQVLDTVAGHDRRGGIATTVTVLVEDGLSGVDSGELFRFTLPGGVVGERGMVIAGVPRYEPGERVLLFLESESGRGLRMPVGLAQGSFRVGLEPDGSRSLTRDLGDIGLVDPSTGRMLPRSGTQRFERAALVAAVRETLARSGR
jgi:hypothetical protein